MTDVVDASTRSRMMSGIRGQNTKPEILVRSLLHRQGFRFRLHVSNLPSKPDIVLPRYRVVIFVHGCFWHGHDCNLFKWPKSNAEFWRTKLESNRVRDKRDIALLLQLGWRVLIIWECAIQSQHHTQVEAMLKKVDTWIRGKEQTFLEIDG